MKSRSFVTATLLLSLLMLMGCQSAYYGTMEKLGYHKRDLLKSRVTDARDAQQDAKEQFQSALQKFSAVVRFHGGSLEDKYNQLRTELDRSEQRATAVRKRIDTVDEVAKALFIEWQTELDQYTNLELRRNSEQQLFETRQRYLQLIAAMRKAESRMEPVLVALRDQVLFLKHNLNAQAVASLKNELASVEKETASLIREMEASIAEADSFIKSM